MATEMTPLDISAAPTLLELAKEVQRTKRPRVLRHADKDIAVIAPITPPVSKKHHQPVPPSSKGIPRYTLEQVFGSVPTPPHMQGKDIDEMIQEAKEERVERMMQRH